MKNINTLIFDFDGVIADTESVFAWFDCELLNKHLEKAGLPATLSPKEVRNLAGYASDEKLIQVGKTLGKDLSAYKEEYKQERDAKRTNLYLENKPALGKNIKLITKTLGQKRCALATNKLLWKLEIDMQHMDITDLFETIITTDPPIRRKPEPDMILEAMKRLSATPKDCAYIGDNPNDIIAAKSANVTPIGFVIEGINNAPQRTQSLKDHGAEMVIDDFAELLQYITR